MKIGKLVPDWVIPKSIGLVWPENLPEKRHLVNLFYIKLIELLLTHLPADLKLTIIHRQSEKERLNRYFGKDPLNLIENKNIQDIWIRDFAPFWKTVGNKVIAVKGKYYPEYGGEVYVKYSFLDDDAGIGLGGDNFEPLMCNNIRIVLDGGNLTFNGVAIGICTNRIISSNEYLFVDQLTESIMKALCLDKLILLPSEFGDDTGHIDGIVRFVSMDTVLVSENVYKWKKGKNYIPESEYYFEQNQFNEITEYLLKHGLKVYRIPNGIPLMSKFESAVGNYMNFLRVGEKVFVPQYERMSEDLDALEAFRLAGFLRENIIRVPGCSELSELGGVLNCITTHIY